MLCPSTEDTPQAQSEAKSAVVNAQPEHGAERELSLRRAPRTTETAQGGMEQAISPCYKEANVYYQLQVKIMEHKHVSPHKKK